LADNASRNAAGSPDGPTSISSGAGGSFKTRWAFVPLMPKELTPAILATPSRFQGVACEATRTGNSDHEMWGFGSVK